MELENGVRVVRTELEEGIGLRKCQQCGCMESTLKHLAAVLPTIGTAQAVGLQESTSTALEKMRPVRYSCLGCEHCYPAVAQNAFARVFPEVEGGVGDLACDFQVDDGSWPPVVGEYIVVDGMGPVAVSTLASIELPDEIARRRPEGLAIVGKTETENIGIDKVVKNIASSPTIRYLIVAGAEPEGHLTGQTLLSLAENGVDDNGRVLGSGGRRPILRNVSAVEIEAFREQVQVVDMIGCEDSAEIGAKIEQLSREGHASCGCNECGEKTPTAGATVPTLHVGEPGETVKMDGAGYFVILPLRDRGVINVEHYAYDNSLLRIVEGPTARAIYRALVDRGWVTELSHAAYLGKELARAELSLRHGFKYVQDGA